VVGQLLTEFQRESLGLHFDFGRPVDAVQWELLGRHHGLPTTILDWTRSPYVAAFFAFSDPQTERSNSVAVWALDLDVLVQASPQGIDVIDDVDAMWSNPRAVQQRAVFLRLFAATMPLERLLDQFVVRYEIPSSDRAIALDELDGMTINARRLFGDLESAARTAVWRVLSFKGG